MNDSLATDLRLACQLVSRRVRFESSPELAPHLVSVLAKLRERGRTPGELADLERISAPSLTRTANCLADKGLISRDDHPSDGRSKVLTLTTAGRDALDRVARARDDWMDERLRGLDDEERDLLRRAVDLINTRVLA